MKVSKTFLALASIPALAGIFFGAYVLRWISVVFLSVVTIFYLFGQELRISYTLPQREERIQRKSEFERSLNMIRKARKGAVSRSLIEDGIIEIYMTLSENPAEVYQRLHREPNRALLELRKGGDFLDNLERALEIVEEDINEGGGSQP
ncbi:hypothetical protein A3L09_01090 [Thermococcus profundus]|uniref:Uncharacterized protein n=1 Tax=Thermococcus profundus TaxID=49899 RepID=A0A2Z2M9B3_THEPR|nr:hypothetical protein [Thermococcus profundus]ASJ01953.1 hypothetical protein A3L09_01090 [Thermococcus profundus]